MNDETNISSTVNAVKGLVEAVPVYQDVVQPAAKEIGVALQTVVKTVHILLAPVSGMVWGYDQIKEFVGTKVAEKLKQIPEERLRTPEPNIAGPALESLRYTGHQEELRDMYASLLASAMDQAFMSQAHPSFVEMIRQLSSDEAKILRFLAYAGAQPMIDLRNQQVSPRGGRWAIKNFSLVPYNAQCVNPLHGPAYLVNLQRLGLIELREHYRLNGQGGVDPYLALKNHEEITAAIEEIKKELGHTSEIWDGAIHLTPLGRQFCVACIFPHGD